MGVAVEVGAVSICTFVLVSKYFCNSKASAFVLVKQGVLAGVAVEVGAFVAGGRGSESVSIFTFVLVKQGQFCTSKASKHP